MNPTEIILENIYTRRSVRRFLLNEIPSQTVEKILRAGMSAPSGWNSQPWEFIVLTDRKKLSSIASAHEYAHMLNYAPLAIVVCGVLDKVEEAKNFWEQDCSAASQNILLATHALGLGAVWCGVYPNHDKINLLRQELNLPPNVVPLNIIAIGEPEGSGVPLNKWDKNKIHHETW